MNSKIILLNGPALCGKGEAVKAINKMARGLCVPDLGIDPILVRSCKDSLIDMTCKLFGVSKERFDELYNDRGMKETPVVDFKLSKECVVKLNVLLGGGWTRRRYISVREALIFVSECVIKPSFGSDWFGKARAGNLEDGCLYIDDSCGFEEELPPLIERVGQENILLVRIYGRGKFDRNDSRDYIPTGIIDNTVDVYNTKSEEEYLSTMVDLAKRFYLGEDNV